MRLDPRGCGRRYRDDENAHRTDVRAAERHDRLVDAHRCPHVNEAKLAPTRRTESTGVTVDDSRA